MRHTNSVPDDYSGLRRARRRREGAPSRRQNLQMPSNRWARTFALSALLYLPTESALAQIPKANIGTCNPQLEKLLLNRRLVVKVSFPASARGIDLSLDGQWDPKETSRRIKASGLGIEIDEAATVNQVKLKDDLLEIQLNGGGFGTFMDNMMSSQKQRQERSVGKASAGSRINLRFNRAVSCEELTDAKQMAGFLSPILDPSALKMVAAQQALPPEWAEAAAQKKVLVGMDKATVFAIFGEPKQKQVDLAGDPPTEKWVYELADLKTRVVTFKEGKVAKVDEF